MINNSVSNTTPWAKSGTKAGPVFGADPTRCRKLSNFWSGLEPAHIHALSLVKACAVANTNCVITDEQATAIKSAADQVIAGEHDDQFPIDIFQTGSGTSSNMNTNEVLANLANQALQAAGSETTVHPNDHVNASQSSNDVFPTSVHVAVTNALVNDLKPALAQLAEALERKSKEFASVVKSGRTHLMDATPVTMGQEFGGYAAQVRYGVERIDSALPRVAEVPLGGTAVGTGINTPIGFSQRVIEILSEESGLPITEARNHFEAQANRDGLVEASSQLRNIAYSLLKINNDLRWMGSGPNTGLGELSIPDLQPGSSIMPGKVNPVIVEAVSMVCAQVIGNDTTISLSTTNGAFELNVESGHGVHLLESIRLLANSSRDGRKMIDGLKPMWNALHFWQAHRRQLSHRSIRSSVMNMPRKSLNMLLQKITVREATVDLGYVERGDITEEQLTRH